MDEVYADALPDGGTHLVANTEADVLFCRAFQSGKARQAAYLARFALCSINAAFSPSERRLKRS